MSNRGAELGELFRRPETVLMPMWSLSIHAQMAEAAGFEAFHISGAMSAWWAEGVGDVGYPTMTLAPTSSAPPP